MDHVIASAGLRLRYLRDFASIREIDAQEVLDDLSEPGTHYALGGWFSRVALTDFDHVVLATECQTGRHVAMLIANDGEGPSGPYLDVRAAAMIGAICGSRLMHRLLAYAISRISCFGAAPRIIAAQTSVPTCYRLLATFSQEICGATVFPQADSTLINMESARLARTISRGMGLHLGYESGTGTIKGARLTNATCFALPIGTAPLVDRMFERNLSSGDQMLVVVDMRDRDEAVIDATMRGLIRSRWKTPFLAMRGATIPTAARISNHKPTLTA